jgi:hypothetical protein
MEFDRYLARAGVRLAVLALTLPASIAAQNLAGRITSSSDGSAIPGASVEVLRSRHVMKSTKTDATGQFTITGLSSGDYTVRTSATWHRSKTVKITFSTSQTLDVSLDETAACSNPTVDVSPTSTNDPVEGPVCVRVKFNALRYVGKVGENVTRDAAVDVSKLFPVPSAGAAKGAVPPPSANRPSHMASGDLSGLGCGDHASTLANMEDAFQDMLIDKCAQRRLFDQDVAQVRSLEAGASSVLDQINTAVQEVDEQVSSANTPNGLQALFAVGGVIPRTRDAISQFIPTWPKFEERLTFVRSLQDNLEAFRLTRYPPPVPPVAGATYTFADFVQSSTNLAAYNDLRSELLQLESDVRAVLTDASRFQAFQKKVGTLFYWSEVLSSTTAPSFFITHEVVSGSLFNFTKHKTIQLATQDRLPTLQQQPVSPSVTTDLIVVDFGNPFSISGGVAFSSVGEREFAIVDSPGPPNNSTTPPTPTSTKTFGITNHSSIHPLPIGIVHVRLYQWANGNYGFHASFGIDGNLQPDNAGGSGVEFLNGLSLSFRHFAYLTVGWHLGRTSRLTGGFKVGDVVPSGISAPPIQKSYTSGVGLAITFTSPSK